MAKEPAGAPAEAADAPPPIKDVTAKLKEHNPANRLYEIRGMIVKVKALELPGTQFGVRAFIMTASECDEAGQAKRHGEGYRIAPERRVTLMAAEARPRASRRANAVPGPAAKSFADQLEDARLAEVLRMEQVVALEDAKLPGTAPLKP